MEQTANETKARELTDLLARDRKSIEHHEESDYPKQSECAAVLPLAMNPWLEATRRFSTASRHVPLPEKGIYGKLTDLTLLSRSPEFTCHFTTHMAPATPLRELTRGTPGDPVLPVHNRLGPYVHRG